MGGQFEIGIAKGLSLSGAVANRDLSGNGAFQRGAEDARLGLAFWPLLYKDKLRAGVNGNLILPTGFREQQAYYDSTANNVVTLPAYTLDQTAAQFSFGTSWSPGRAAELAGFAGYMGTSDNLYQAFRWGMGLSLTPFGKTVGASFDYGQSITRAGTLPNTEVLRGGLDVELPWGFGLHPGVYAELEDDPMIGAAVGLSFQARLPHSVYPDKPRPPKPAVRLAVALVAPPISDQPMADNEQLWKNIRESLKPSFEAVLPLESLDLPGLPFEEVNRGSFWNSMAAIAAAYPDARWLLITHVENESVSRAAGLSIPLVVTQPTWEATCKLRVQLVDLIELAAYPEQIIEASAIGKEGLRSPMLSSLEKEKLSLERVRELTLEAYRKAGVEIAIALPQRGEGE
jgi:hypothetical protein